MTIKDFYQLGQAYTSIYFSINGEVKELSPLFADLLGDCVIESIIPGKQNGSGRYTIEDAGCVTLQLKTKIVRA